MRTQSLRFHSKRFTRRSLALPCVCLNGLRKPKSYLQEGYFVGTRWTVEARHTSKQKKNNNNTTTLILSLSRTSHDLSRWKCSTVWHSMRWTFSVCAFFFFCLKSFEHPPQGKPERIKHVWPQVTGACTRLLEKNELRVDV